jgi:ferredoxin, 2Fe-2S
MSTFNITFQPLNVTVQADSALPTPTRDGKPGSLLAIALAHDIEVDHACGGVCACSTCHVIVKRGFDSLAPASEDEEDMLDNAPGLSLQSRLACQAVPDGSADLEVEIPHWNRNLVSEDHPTDDV